MFFSTIFSFAILLATAAADLHDSCTCHNGDSYNARMTSVACSSYDSAGYKWGGASYNSVTGRCTGADGGKLAGDQWEDACKNIASKSGYPCADGKGTCYASSGDVSGSC